MKIVYCANCGRVLPVLRKALPKYGKVIDIVEYHKCSDGVEELSLTPANSPLFKSDREHNKFVQKLDELQPSASIGATSTSDLRDRRKAEHVRETDSTAPAGLLDMMRSVRKSD